MLVWRRAGDFADQAAQRIRQDRAGDGRPDRALLLLRQLADVHIRLRYDQVLLQFVVAVCRRSLLLAVIYLTLTLTLHLVYL